MMRYAALTLILASCTNPPSSQRADPGPYTVGTNSTTGGPGATTGTTTTGGSGAETGTGTGTGTGTSGVTSAGPYDTLVGGPCVGQTQAGVYVGPTVIRCIDVACTVDDWTWDVLTDGWTRGGTIHIHYESGGDEEHDIASIGYDPNSFWWDLLEEELYATNFVHSVSTDAECGVDGPTTLTVAIEVYDWNLDELAKCVVFGADPSYYTTQSDYSGCDVWTW